MGAISDYDKARRTGGPKTHPRSEDHYLKYLPKFNWPKIRSGLVILLAIVASIGIVNGLPSIDEIKASFPQPDVREIIKEVPVEKIVEKPIEVIKWRTKTVVKEVPVTKEIEVPVVNPVNTDLINENRILRDRIAGLEKRLAAYNLDKEVNKRLIDKFYEGAYKNGYKVKLRYDGASREANP